MRRHTLWMVIGCVVPLLLIFILPLFGLGSGISLFIFIILMFVCHLLMTGRHQKGHDNKNDIMENVKLSGEPTLLAQKAGIGRILYYKENDIYELRLEMDFYKRSHFMTGEEWNEFIDFSGQDNREEFFILLGEKYPELDANLKDSEMRMNFLKFIESSYDGSQPSEKE